MSYYTPPSSGGGGGIGGFPKVVAVANHTAQSGNLSFDLLSGALPTGDYLLADTLSIVTRDSSAVMTFTVGFNSDAGVAAIAYVSGNPAAYAGITALGNSYVSQPTLTTQPPLPSTIHALTGTPISVAITVTPTAIALPNGAQVSVGTFGGAGYAPGDTGTFQGGDGTATYSVLTVDGSGRVLTFSATGGTTYPDLGSSASTVVTGAGDGNFRAILTAVAGVVASGVTETHGGFDYAPGDTGTGPGGSAYLVSTVDGNGAVLTLTMTAGGTGNTISTDNPTAVTTGAGDGEMLLDVTALSTSLVYSYHATLTRLQ